MLRFEFHSLSILRFPRGKKDGTGPAVYGFTIGVSGR